MPFWPFRRKPVDNLTPEQMRTRLIAAAGGPPEKLREVCERYKHQVAAHVELMRTVPALMRTDPASVQGYFDRLGALAHCLATECQAPELWNALRGTPDSNPLLKWEHWYGELAQRMEKLEYDALIAEAKDFIVQARKLQGHPARLNEAYLQGRLGELLFHSGRASDAIEPFQAARAVCQKMGDVDGEFAYIGNLLEIDRYLGDAPAGEALVEEAVALAEQHGKDAEPYRRWARQLRDGEPLCRVVCVRDGREWELDEPSDGHYQFVFRRNRESLRKALTLVQQGSALAAGGELADALTKYQEAAEVDPHDPNPTYLAGACLMELGAYAQAHASFEEVERLAPGWFGCRAFKWLTGALEDGTVGDREYRLARVLEDGGLEPSAALSLAEQAVADFPDFAPFRLFLGDLLRGAGRNDEAIQSYRDGLARVADPDTESRLLVALAAALSKESTERVALLDRALDLEGNLVARAMARLLRSLRTDASDPSDGPSDA